jgi:RNA polymerase sigma-70 factor (ECF subfamily)
MDGLTDTELGNRIVSGDKKAFRALYDRYHAQMYYIAKKYVKKSTIAEDAVQDVFIRFWENRENIDESKSVKGFLFVMLKNHLLNVLRKNKREIISFTESTLKPSKSSIMTDDEVIYKEYHKILERGLKELSERKREVFELRTIKGRSNSEVAKLLHIDIKTVKTHYYLSSKFIRKYLKVHAGIFKYLLLVISSSIL